MNGTYAYFFLFYWVSQAVSAKRIEEEEEEEKKRARTNKGEEKKTASFTFFFRVLQLEIKRAYVQNYTVSR